MATRRPIPLQPSVLRRGLECVCALLVLAGCAIPATQPTPTPDPGWAARWEAAVRAGDDAACRRSIAGSLAAQACPALLAGDPADFRASVVAPNPGAAQLPAGQLRIRVNWRVGTDPHVASHEFVGAFAGTGADTRLVSLPSSQPGPVPIWLTDPAPVRSDGAVTLLGACPSDTAERTAAARAAVAAAPLGALSAGWDGSVVVECPGSAATFDRVLGASFGAYRGAAAVAWPYGSAPDAAVHVVLNPDVPLDSDAAALVLRHELVHVATRSYRWTTTWVTEGLADAVAADAAYRDASNAAVRADVAARGVPAALPANPDFATADPNRLNLTYGYARLAVDTLVDHVGWEAAGPALAAWATDPAATVDGIGVSDLTAWWQERLRG